MTVKQPHAVLWDMDGTLIDSEPYWMAAETPLVESFGGTWDHEQALQLVGLGLHDAARVLQGAGVRMEVDAIVEHLTDDVLRQMGELGVPFRPGAQELLRELRAAGVKTALVTMSMHRMAAAIVELLEFDAFDLVLGGDDVPMPKPHPDPYLRAAELLDVDIAHTVAIEDSPNGLRAAVSSGAVSLGVPHFVGLDGVGAHELWPTLEGRGIADITALYSAHRS
ncbi:MULTISPECIES: HAD family hydrolase [Microbacterium]|uniref:HAD family hydrolase n=1 Tax=Microbacterium TaxID=33882 RepID=UPI0024AFDFF5|nr:MULTISPECIES: HAD family phosphatase [Microbacterium]MDI6942408.1 HAD family phosphatase [Microbacterium barkeri]